MLSVSNFLEGCVLIIARVFNRVQPYFKRHSNFRIFLENIFLNKYDVRDILENDFDAILASVSFIQNREPSSFYVPHYFMNQLL